MHENPKVFVERLALTLLLMAATLASIWAAVAILLWPARAGALFATANALFLLAGLLQAEVSGWLSRMADLYADREQGPPSYETRRIFILYNPDNRLSRWWGDFVFFETRTAFWLIFIGTVLAIPAAWL